MKSRFLSNMSHEFRTPLSSIRALSRLLLDGIDGDLNDEQKKQVEFILKGAESLNELVDDLLDLAKIEAGKIDIRPTRFYCAELFSALRGMLRPLLISERVELVFEPVAADLVLYADEAKVSQVLRNFISNALKFTEVGIVHVSVALLSGGKKVRFLVRDTGVGIAETDQQLIFEEFGQVANKLQARVKGTGLGLPLCRRLAELLCGVVDVKSELGKGSQFSLTIPVIYKQPEDTDTLAVSTLPVQKPVGLPLLVIEDNPALFLLYQSYFRLTPFTLTVARSSWEADEACRTQRPIAIILDLYLNGEDMWRWLTEFKNNVTTRQIPVVIVSEVSDHAKGLLVGADAYFVKPVERNALVQTLMRLCNLGGVKNTTVATA